MREHGVHQVFFGGFQLASNDIALDKFSHLGPHHMRAQQLTCFGVKDGFDHAAFFAQGDGFAVADKRETADFDVISKLFGFGFVKDLGIWRVNCVCSNLVLG